MFAFSPQKSMSKRFFLLQHMDICELMKCTIHRGFGDS